MTAREKTAAIVLAAGHSRRFGPSNKLLQTIDDIPLIRKTVDTVAACGFKSVVVVTGHDADVIEATLFDLSVTCVRNATPYAGMGTSLATGANALSPEIEAAFVVLGDMPRLKSATLLHIAERFEPETGKDIAVPICDGRRGHPVLFGARYLPKLGALTGDEGARQLLRENPERIQAIAVDDAGTLLDIDTQDDLGKLDTPKLSIGES